MGVPFSSLFELNIWLTLLDFLRINEGLREGVCSPLVCCDPSLLAGLGSLLDFAGSVRLRMSDLPRDNAPLPTGGGAGAASCPT